MGKENKQDGFFVVLIKLLSKLLDFFKSKSDKNDQQLHQLEINKAKNELRKALAEGRINDIVYWKEKLKQLSSILIVIFAVSIMGCINKPVKPEISPIVIGDRLMKVESGQIIKIPELIKPARTWYLIDDEAMYQLFDIDISNSHKKQND